MSGDDDGFLGRWSRRKRGEESDPSEETAPREARAVATVAPIGPPEPVEPVEPETDEALLERMGFRHPDLLDGDELRRFVRAAVPQHLKRIALRRLWRSNPVLANLDGLNDYDTDFTGGSVAPGELKTLYAVGRGFWKGLPPDPSDEVATPEDADGPEVVAAAVEPVATAPDHADTADARGAGESEDTNEADAMSGDIPDKIGRMKFRFED